MVENRAGQARPRFTESRKQKTAGTSPRTASEGVAPADVCWWWKSAFDGVKGVSCAKKGDFVASFRVTSDSLHASYAQKGGSHDGTGRRTDRY